MKKSSVTIGIAAYNEEKNIEKLLDSIFKQKLVNVKISQVIIVSSGSTDRTNSIVASLKKKHSSIQLFKQKKRLGKAKAVNIILSKAKENIIILTSADLIIPETTFEKLITPFRKYRVGIVGSRPIPLNDRRTFFGFAAHMLWNLHHIISLQTPKMGECIAFRKVFKQIPELSSVDEANIESLIKGQGYDAIYSPRAIIYNKGAENLKDFIAGRRRIYFGHLVTKYKYGYSVSTIYGFKILLTVLKNMPTSGKEIIWTGCVILLEAYSRLLGFMDLKKNRKHVVWQRVESTKKLF